MKRRLMSAILALALLVGALFCFNISIVQGATSGNCGASGSILQTGSNAKFNYDKATKTLTITGNGDTKDYGDTAVNRAPWYDYKTEIETVIIDEGIENIGTLSFYGCTALTSVKFPSTLKTISGSKVNYGAFRECTSLDKITLPQNITTIEAMAFRGCSSLKSITFPDSLTTLDDGAFMECTNLETVKYGTGLNSTGVRMFYGSGVRNVIFSSTITAVDSYSFFNCKMTDIELPQEIASIGTRAFANCTFISSVTVNNPNTLFEGIVEEDPFNGSNQQITFYGHKGSTTEKYVTDHPNSDYVFVSIDPCDHVSTHEEITREPNCTEKGTTTQVCDECGFVVSTSELPAKGHSWEISESYDETESDGHIYNSYLCANCMETKEEIEHIAFVEGFYDFTTTSTCTTPGIDTYTCKVKGCGKVERKLALTVHHTVEKYDVKTEPNCTQAGSEEGLCTVCGNMVTREIAPLGHQNQLTDTLDNTLEDGHTYEIYNCSVCDEETITSEHIEWVEGYYTSAVLLNPTCTVNGLQRDTCNICSQTRNVSIPANGQHDWYETARTEPNCTAVGKIYYACHNCNLTKSENIDALGHDYVIVEESTVPPTCTDAGYNTWKCNRCGSSTRDVVNATGHTVDELNYSVISDPNCVNDGKASSVCKTCGTEFEITIEALGHNYEDVLTPIPEKPGHSMATPTCTRCKTTQSARTQHDEWIEGSYTTAIITQGSCAVPRVTRDTCDLCGETRTNTVPAPGHKYKYTGVNDNGRLSYTCDVCGEIYTASISGALALWNVRYINTSPYDTVTGYMFELTGDNIINAKDYSVLVRLNKTKSEP